MSEMKTPIKTLNGHALEDTEARAKVNQLSEEIEDIKENGGGGGGAIPDWNQNDETAPDYIKNRPFYHRIEEATLFDGNVEVVDNPERDAAEWGWFECEYIKLGATYVVTVNGAEYRVVGQENSYKEVFIGNVTLANYADIIEGDIPFAIVNDVDYPNVLWFSGVDAGTYTVTIKEVAEEIVKIPEKFIDFPIPMVVNLGVESLDADGTNLKYTMDKTFLEIKNAVRSGRIVHLLKGSDSGLFYTMYPIQLVEPYRIVFFIYNEKYKAGEGFSIDQEGNVTKISHV